jgi:hypothetical protein
MRASLVLAVLLLACSGSTDAAPDEVSDSESSDTSSMQETTTTSPPGDSAPVMETAPPAVSFEGYWVWKEVVEAGAVKQTITDEDMTWKVGSTGWPGCPDGISCTKYGIDVLYVNATRFHHMHRVTTGSDYQDYGAYTVKDDLITYEQVQAFSCAHPKEPTEYVKPATKYARFKKMGADLWVSDFADKDPGAMASKWTVYRATTKTDAHNKYDHPFCGEAREGGKCHCLCPSQDVLTDYTCAK